MDNRYLVQNLFGTGINIAWYAVIMCVGIIAGAVVAKILSKKRGFRFDLIIDFLILAIPFGIVCARLYYVFSEWDMYAQNPAKIIAVWEGGLAIYGAVIGAIIAALIFCKWKKFPIGHLLDFGGCGLIIGQAIGRWGNFVNQEAFGTAVTNPSMQWFPFAVHIDGTHYVAVFNEATGKMIRVVCEEPWHLATFFYESMWNLLVFIVLLWFFYKKAKRPGNVFALYLIGYGIGRAFIEGLRTDSLWLIPGAVRISQALSIVLVIGGILYLVLVRNRPMPPAYTGFYNLNYEPPAKPEISPNEEPVGENPSSTEGDVSEELRKEDKMFDQEDATQQTDSVASPPSDHVDEDEVEK